MVIFILSTIIAFLFTIILILVIEIIELKESRDRYYNREQRRFKKNWISFKRHELKLKRMKAKDE